MWDRTGLIERGFTGFARVADLWTRESSVVPSRPGAYLVFRDTDDAPSFLRKSVGGHFKKKDPSVPLDRLKAEWVPNSRVLYLGKAGNQTGGVTLQRRVELYLRFGAGQAVAHWGGRLIWQLADHRDLLIAWQVTTGRVPREVEATLLQDFAGTFGRLPFANLQF